MTKKKEKIVNLQEYREDKCKNKVALNDEWEYTDKEKSDDFLEEAYETENRKKAIKLAQEALKLNPQNYDAENFLTHLEDDPLIRLDMYKKTLKKAKTDLEKEDYFSEKNKGMFYSLWETRPFMRTKHAYMTTLIELGRFTGAIKEAEEMLRLNESDNMGVRYILLPMYILLEKFKKAEELIKNYQEYSALMLLPKAILEYKQGNYEACDNTLAFLEDENEYIVPLLLNDDTAQKFEDSYQSGSEEEATLAINTCYLLLATAPSFVDFVDEHQWAKS